MSTPTSSWARSPWNDPQIAAANPGLKLPDTPITVVVRADSSGTTAVFTKHLAAINPEFKRLGEGNTVNWPASDKFIKSPKNDGVTATVRQTPGAIGYIEYGFAKLAKVDFASCRTRPANTSCRTPKAVPKHWLR
jgi:phosphate transport system substrate-binding protein